MMDVPTFLQMFLVFTLGVLTGVLVIAAYLHIVAQLLKASD